MSTLICYIDLVSIDIQDKASYKESLDTMRSVHALIGWFMEKKSVYLDACYLLNDGVFLVSELNAGSEDRTVNRVMMEIKNIKLEVDKFCDNRIVVILERMSPELISPKMILSKSLGYQETKTARLMTSSYGLSNCITLSNVLRRNSAIHWFIDGRVVCEISTTQKYEKMLMPMQPTEKLRNIYGFYGDI